MNRTISDGYVLEPKLPVICLLFWSIADAAIFVYQHVTNASFRQANNNPTAVVVGVLLQVALWFVLWFANDAILATRARKAIVYGAFILMNTAGILTAYLLSSY